MARRGKVRGFVLAATVGVIASPNQHRKCIAFYGADDVSYSVSTEREVLHGQNGVLVGGNRSAAIFRIEDWGDLVTKAWYGIALGASQGVAVESEDDTTI